MTKFKFEPLTALDDYPRWKRDIECFLTTKKLKAYLTRLPDDTIPDDTTNDELALAYLTMAIDYSLRFIIDNHNSTFAAWTRLADFTANNVRPQLMNLLDQLHNLKQKGGETMQAYWARAMRLRELLASAGDPVDDVRFAHALIKGLLHSDSGPIQSVIGIYRYDRQPPMSVERLRLNLLQAESDMNGSAGISVGAEKALVTIQKGVTGRPAYSGPFNSTGSPSGNSGSPSNKSNATCYYCHKKGHLIAQCRKRKAAMARGNRHPIDNNSRSHVTLALASIDIPDTSLTSGEVWILDSGASRHVAFSPVLLKNTTFPINENPIQYGNGATSMPAAVGSVEMMVGDGVPFMLTNVMCDPSAKYNLLSMSAARRDGYTFDCTSVDGGIVMKKGDVVVGTAYEMYGVYVMFNQLAYTVKPKSDLVNTSNPVLASVTREHPELWHYRLGHLGYDNLAKLAGMVDGINVPASAFSSASAATCEPCLDAKQKKLPFHTRDRVTKPLELVHSDLCGPFKIKSVGGARYWLTLKDDYTGYASVIALEKKSDTTVNLLAMLRIWSYATGRAVGALRTDNGGEYVDKDLVTGLKSLGIRHEYTDPYTPQQNGVAERFNRILLERVRAMLSGLPKELWAEAAVTASYILNLSPSSGRAQTPWELLHGKRPNLAHLRVFGAKVSALIPDERRNSKLDAVSIPGILVGYNNNHSYRIYTGQGRVTSSRHIRVLEEIRNLKPREYPVSPDGQHQEVPAAAASSPSATAAPVTVTTPGTPRVTAPGSNAGPDTTADTAPPSTTVQSLAPPAVRSTATRLNIQRLSNEGLPVQRLFPDEEPAPAGQSGTVSTPAAPAAPPVAPEPPAAPPAAEPLAPAAPAPATRTSSRIAGKGWRKLPRAYADDYVAAAAIAVPDVIEEPLSYEEAMASDQREEWVAAMIEELESLHANNTWSLEETPADVNPIPVKWVYKIKRDGAGNVERFKARLVVKGFKQQEGVDYDEVFAPVSKYSTFRALMAKAAYDDMEIHQLDVKTAFLQGDLQEQVWVMQPPAFEDGSGMSCHLHKAMYGLKQAPRAWHIRLDAELTKLGFIASAADASLYVSATGDVYLLVYVDDIVIIAHSIGRVNEVKSQLLQVFDARDMGEAGMFLGIVITRHRAARTITLANERMVTDLVIKYDLFDCKPAPVPLSNSITLNKSDGDLLDVSTYPYRQLVGSLMYIAVTTRPDIAFAVGALARYFAEPTTVHWHAAKHVLRYLAGTRSLGIKYGGSDTSLLGYSDADYAGDSDSRKSTSGYVFLMYGGAISWSSRRQPTVAASTTEAEYMALGSAVKEALWLRILFTDLQYPVGAVSILADNQSAIKIMRNPVSSMRTKHIDVLHHFARERVMRKEIIVQYVPTLQMVADVMTKALPTTKHTTCCIGMGMV